MDSKIMASSAALLGRQRNFFAILSAGFGVIIMFLSLALMTQSRQTILVPACFKDKLALSNTQVSEAYLIENAEMFLSNLLNLNPNNIDIKKQFVKRFVSPNHWQQISDYFDEQVKKYKPAGLRTVFTAREYEVDGLDVRVVGLLQAYYGKDGYKDQKVKYVLKFDYNGILSLKEFSKIEE